VLVGLDCIIAAQADGSHLFDRVRRGLKGDLDATRYGLPFVGDNNFMIDRIDEVMSLPETVVWYARIAPDDLPRKGSCRLTVGIDRVDNSKTTSYLYAPIESGGSEPPDSAWTWTPREPVMTALIKGTCKYE
jgi:CRISPR-associated protein Cas5t